MIGLTSYIIWYIFCSNTCCVCLIHGKTFKYHGVVISGMKKVHQCPRNYPVSKSPNNTKYLESVQLVIYMSCWYEEFLCTSWALLMTQSHQHTFGINRMAYLFYDTFHQTLRQSITTIGSEAKANIYLTYLKCQCKNLESLHLWIVGVKFVFVLYILVRKTNYLSILSLITTLILFIYLMRTIIAIMPAL